MEIASRDSKTSHLPIPSRAALVHFRLTMIEEEKKSGKEPIIIFLILSVCIHALLFYLIPKLPAPPKIKSEKPISVKFIEEQPVKGKKKAPKKAHALGKENITVKKEMRPENKPKVMGAKKLAQHLPPPISPQPSKKVLPSKPIAPKKSAKVILPQKIAPKKKRPVKPAPKPTREIKKAPRPIRNAPKPQEKILTTRHNKSFKVAEAHPKQRLPSPSLPSSAPVRKKPKETTAPISGPSHPSEQKKAPPLPAPKSLFPSPKTLYQIERKYSQSFPKNIPKGDVISLNTKSYKYISYFTHIKRKIELVWEYPRAAAEMGQEGSLTLRFTILKDGRLAGVWLIQSSGYRLLDQEAMRAVREAAPFNPIPDRLKKDHLNIMATFTYTLGFKFVY